MAKKYYWLKLKADWFSDKRIKKLRSIAGGDTYTIIYLKMMLLSLKDEGKLYFEGVEDDFASEIALALDEGPENVKLTLTFLEQHGLIEICDDDKYEYQLTEVPKSIGSETASTIRSRECRERQKQLALEQKALQCNTNATGGNTSQQFCSVEREKEIEIERDKETEKEGEGEKEIPAHAPYGKFRNVLLSDTELDGLKAELPDRWGYYIDRLSVHIASSGKQYHNHAATIYKWAQEDAEKALHKKGMPDYSYSEGDSL